VKFILNRRIKYYTKEMIRFLCLIGFALFIITTIVFVKFNFVCSISISGEHIGYVSNKEIVESKINEIHSLSGTNNIAFIDTVVPEYEFTLVSKDIKLNDEEVLSKVNEETKYTYRYYAVTLDGKQKSIVNTLEEAEKIVADMKKEYSDSVKFTIGINELYSDSADKYKVASTKVAKTEISKQLKKVKEASVNKVYLSKVPVSGVITSRFGNRESIRKYAHTGLDIAAPLGTDIKSASSGKVAFSGYMGSYGNLIIIDAGNDVEIYYGHCSKLLVDVGDTVKAGDIIGKVGSTGNSTGNHLHFEIRVDGTRVNPQNYIYKGK